MARDTDKELVRRVQKGDRRAFDLLFSRYQHKIHGLVSRYVRAHDEIDDVVQEAFIKAYRALPRFRGESAFYTWLYRIAINTAKNYLVARSRRPPDVDVDAPMRNISTAATRCGTGKSREQCWRATNSSSAINAAIGATAG